MDNPIFHPFDTLYESKPDDGDRFGPLGSTIYHPPMKFRPFEWYPVIELLKDAKSDGFNVTIMELRAPARFYRVVVHPTRNSVGTMRPGITLATGSSAEELAWTIATAFREGNLAPNTDLGLGVSDGEKSPAEVRCNYSGPSGNSGQS